MYFPTRVESFIQYRPARFLGSGGWKAVRSRKDGSSKACRCTGNTSREKKNEEADDTGRAYLHAHVLIVLFSERTTVHTHTHTYSGSVAVSLALILTAGPCCINLKSLFKAKSRFGTCYRFQIRGAVRGEDVCVRWLEMGRSSVQALLILSIETLRGDVGRCALNGCRRPIEPRQI